MDRLMYAAICYNVLTSGDHHPTYLTEKLSILGEGLNAFAHLDYKNMQKAVEYCSRWHVPVPAPWTAELELQRKVWIDWEAMGL